MSFPEMMIQVLAIQAYFFLAISLHLGGAIILWILMAP